MYTAEADRTIDYCNQRWYEYTGMPAGSARGRWPEAIHPDDLPRIVKEGGRCAAQGEATELEYRMRRHDGAYRWFLSRSLPLRNDQGRITRWVGLSTDIDDRKRAEVALAESESRFRSLADSVADFVSLHNMESRFEYASPSCKPLGGYEPVELVGRNAYDFIHPDDQARIRRDSHELNLAGRESLVQWRLRRKDGTYVWVETNTSVVKDDHGQPVQILCTTRDISERKRAEDALREQKEILQTIFDHAPVMVSFFDPRGRYLLVNRAWQETLGIAADEAPRARCAAGNVSRSGRAQPCSRVHRPRGRHVGRFPNAHARSGACSTPPGSTFASKAARSLGLARMSRSASSTSNCFARAKSACGRSPKTSRKSSG